MNGERVCCRLVALVLLGAIVLLILCGCATNHAAPPSCEQSANPDICELEQRLDQIENSARYRELQRRMESFERDAANNARRTCEFAHGAGSILCQ